MIAFPTSIAAASVIGRRSPAGAREEPDSEGGEG